MALEIILEQKRWESLLLTQDKMVDSDDEDILYANDLGRNLIGGKREKTVDDVLNGDKKDKRKLRKTLALCMAFLCLGLCRAILGPTLLSLQRHLHTTLPKISWVFAGRSIGYLSGAILGGMLFESFDPLFLLAVCLLLCGIGIVIAPYVTTVMFLAICMSSVGIGMGVLDTGANLLCLRMWGKKRSGTMLQALYLSFAVGACIAPLVAAPFLVETNSITPLPNSTLVLNDVNHTNVKYVETMHGKNDSIGGEDDGTGERGGGGGNKGDTSKKAFEEKSPTNMTNKNTTTNGDHQETSPSPSQHQVGRFAIAYIIIGVLVLVNSGVFFYFLCTKPKHELQYIGPDQANDTSDMNNFPFRTRILILLFFFYFLYVGGEVAYGSFVSVFAKKSELTFEEDRASHVAAVFWGMFSLGRGLAICLASVISPLKMVIMDMVGCVATSLALTLFADSYENVLWIGSALLGLSMASLFPSGIAWLESYTPVTGSTTSFLIVGRALGEMCVPVVIGYLFNPKVLGPIVLMYWILATSGLSLFIFIYVMQLVMENGQEKKSLPAEKSPALELFQSVEEALPMEELFKNTGSNGKQMGKARIPPMLKKKDHKE